MRPQVRALRAGILVLSLGLASSAFAQWNPLNPVAGVKQQDDSVVLAMQSGNAAVADLLGLDCSRDVLA